MKKTKVMTTAGLQEFKLEDNHIEIVDNFNFLGSINCGNADCKKEIWRRLAKGSQYHDKLAKITKDKDIPVSPKSCWWYRIFT